MTVINHESLRNQLARLAKAEPESRRAIHGGSYVGHVVSLATVQARGNAPAHRVTLKIVGGPHAGDMVTAYVHGNALRTLKARQSDQDLFQFEVYVRRSDEGREYSRINVETIRRADEAAVHITAVQPPDNAAIEVVGNPRDYDHGLICIGTTQALRDVVGWRQTFSTWCEGGDGSSLGHAAFLSAYAFGPDVREYMAGSSDGKKAGSVSGYTGIAYGPLFPFDIDRECEDGTPDLERARQDTVRLCEELVRRGVPSEDVLVFSSGRRGFHVLTPASRFGAQPSRGFAVITGRVCKTIAESVGVVLDQHLYTRLQPMRTPNSRHEKTGLFKVRLSIEELVAASIDDITSLASDPRPFPAPALDGEPVERLVELWREAEREHRHEMSVRSRAVMGPDGFHGITRETWDFLINGAREGERADRTFKAAANLSDFDSAEDLITALMARPTALCGLPPAEAEGHIASALRRASEFRVQRKNTILPP
jgi:hypothetical protein